MRSPIKTALTMAAGLFVLALIVGWFMALSAWLMFSSWGQLIAFALLVASLGGLLTWVRGHIQRLDDRITQLSFELDKLKKTQ